MCFDCFLPEWSLLGDLRLQILAYFRGALIVLFQNEFHVQILAYFRGALIVLFQNVFHVQILAYFRGAQFLVNALNAVTLASLLTPLAILLSTPPSSFFKLKCFKVKVNHFQICFRNIDHIENSMCLGQVSYVLECYFDIWLAFILKALCQSLWAEICILYFFIHI